MLHVARMHNKRTQMQDLAKNLTDAKQSVMVNPCLKSDRTSVIKVTRTAQGTQQSDMPEGN
jgi:hypothetical protein